MKVERSKGPGGMLEASAKYWDFALLRTPQNLLNAISHSMPIVLLGTYFGPAVAGYYGIALAVLSVPGNIIGQSVITVFYPRITRSIADKEDSRRLIIKATLIMAILGLAPYAIIASMGPFLFQFVFGEDWRVAGEYAQWMAPLLFLQFVNRPAVASVPALRIQGGLLVYEVFSTATKIGSLWMGFHFYNSAEVSVALFALLGVIAYLWLIVWIIFRSRVDSNT
jgi:O-antigen/teichoic acid export membrane protein